MEERMGQIGVVVRMMRRSERCSGRSGRRGGFLRGPPRGLRALRLFVVRQRFIGNVAVNGDHGVLL